MIHGWDSMLDAHTSLGKVALLASQIRLTSTVQRLARVAWKGDPQGRSSVRLNWARCWTRDRCLNTAVSGRSKRSRPTAGEWKSS